MVVDLLSSRQTTLKFDENLETVYFVVTVFVGWGLASWLLLGYTGRATAGVRSRSQLVSITHIGVTVIQFAILAFLCFVIFNRNYEYLTWNVNTITTIAATVIMVAFSVKFLSWYKTPRKDLLILIYALAVSSLAATIASEYAAKQFFIQVVEEKSSPGSVVEERYPLQNTEQGRIVKQDIGPETTTSYIVPRQYLDAYHYAHQLPSTIAFVCSWAATAITLRHHSRSMGRLAFWALVSTILILYVVGRTPDILKNLEIPAIQALEFQNQIWTNYLYRAGTIVGNVMFGVAFLAMGRSVKPIKDYLYISAVGFMLIGFAHPSNPLQATFGIASHSLVMLSAYLFSVGLYASAISISQDSKLRQSIRKSAKEEVLLDSIGKAQVEQEMEKKVIMIATAQHAAMADQTGIQPSLRDEDMKRYLDTVIKEIEVEKTSNPG